MKNKIKNLLGINKMTKERKEISKLIKSNSIYQ